MSKVTEQEDEPTRDGALDAPWRDRVVARSLGAAKVQTIDRAQALIKAAQELLELSGDTVTVQDVADRAGFSLRILYRHFSSKDDLLAAVLEVQLEQGAAQVRELLARIDDPVDRLREFIRLTTRHEPTPLNLALVRQEARLLLSHPDEVVRAQSPMTTLALELVRSAADAGRLDQDTAERSVYSMMALKRAYNHARLLGDAFGLPLPTADELVNHCLRALGVDADVPTAGTRH